MHYTIREEEKEERIEIKNIHPTYKVLHLCLLQ